MISSIDLKIVDGVLEEEYIKFRNKDITYLSVVSLLIRVITLLNAVISSYTGFRQFHHSYWIVRVIILLSQVACIAIGHKYPKGFQNTMHRSLSHPGHSI